MESVLDYGLKAGVGIFGLLFIALLAWVLRTNDSRENRYLNVIDKLGDKIDDKVDKLGARVGNVEKDVADIKAVALRIAPPSRGDV